MLLSDYLVRAYLAVSVCATCQPVVTVLQERPRQPNLSRLLHHTTAETNCQPLLQLSRKDLSMRGNSTQQAPAFLPLRLSQHQLKAHQIKDAQPLTKVRVARAA